MGGRLLETGRLFKKKNTQPGALIGDRARIGSRALILESLRYADGMGFQNDISPY